MSQQNKNYQGTPRLCHVIKSPKFEGYGFNLHAEKSKPGQYIGKVDEGSPAEAAGLRQGDRILEVNGVDITNETHKQVVERIKQNPNETKLLVVSPNDDGNTQSQSQQSSNNTNTTNSTNSTSTTGTTGTATTAPATVNNTTNATNQNLNNENNNHSTSNNSQDQQQNNHSQHEQPQESIASKLKMTAAELRQQLANKKKYDPKKESIDFKKKFDIVQKL